MAMCLNCEKEANLSAPDGNSVGLGLAIGLVVGLIGIIWIGVKWSVEGDYHRATYYKTQVARGCRPVDRWLDGELINGKTCVLSDGTVLSTR
jgi:hypothetical protein